MVLDTSRPEPVRPAGSAPGGFHTTAALPVLHRGSYWREALSRTFGAMHITAPDGVCSGTIRTAPLGRLRAVTVEGERLSALRTHRLVARGGEDGPVVITLLDRGVARLEQDGREAVLGPGDMFVYDMARPFRLDLPQSFRTKSLVVPRDVLGLSESGIAHVTATPLGADTPLGGLLSPFLAALVDGAGTYSPSTGELMARNVVDLLGGLAGEVLGRSEADTSGGNRALLLRIQAFIDRHLQDPDLTPEAIARAHRISLRYLHKLFESEEATVGRWIQRRRLEECRRDLARHANGSTIAAVAHRWGFISAAHFSRAFRAAYGMAPSEWRDTRGLAPHPPPPARLLSA
ncbi:helix-turn-helix domain-containing protein [Streptomyces sparsogenes]|uniref:AraC family transcriptional regulator n=1 Tax=Streptomyces sparsogenes DSM 40356 TaxID=1331668 RepID=A0A1R1SF97_9ACTN|nr:helix-turn-helix domain-containing protein [Streptomyces sparsogenes]OMI36689.1 AraC family transcriptional regulator [Streptomyces sparsogenes DSM 40356]